MHILDSILDIIFPVHCLGCGMARVDLCIKCLAESPPAERETAKWIFSIYDYRHPPIKKAVWLLKYKGKKRLANIFAQALYPRILEELSELKIMENFQDSILIPIPLSAKRRRERGFNQAEFICQALIKLDSSANFKLDGKLLLKIKETEHQAKIKDRRERLKNLNGSFAVKNEAEKIDRVKGRNIILIDDVTTTGATLNEARKTLKQAGAKKIIAFTVAH